MKILMLGVKEYPYGISSKFERYPGGGTARYVISLSEELAKRGHEVHIIVRLFPGQKKYEINKGIHVHRVGFINNKYLRLPTFNINSYFLAKKIMKKITFDIIHTHGIFGATIGRWLRKRAPIIGTLHGIATKQVKSNYGKLINKVIEYLQKYSYSKLDKLVFLSEDEKNDYKKATGKLPNKYSIIYPGINPINITRKKNKRFTVTFIGRLVPMKGLDKFILSFNILKNKDKTRYLIVGDGISRTNLEKSAKNEHNIIFTGYTKDINKYLSQTDIFLLPSEGGEGLPCSLLEAMSAGIPCMVSNFNAPVKEGSIITIPDNNPRTIAATIEKYFKNKDILKRISLNAKKEFFDNFSIKKYVDNYLNEYKKIIGEAS
jgi:glycosyltransferase involved in cell wall biosynthesis